MSSSLTIFSTVGSKEKLERLLRLVGLPYNANVVKSSFVWLSWVINLARVFGLTIDDLVLSDMHT